MIKKHFDGLQVMLASPEDVKSWSFGSVESPDTINYRTGKPKPKGLFCEAVFGPMKNYECSCGKYKGLRYKGIVCESCGVEVTTSRVRRSRMGHIELAAPVVHIWYVKATPSRIGLLLGLSINEIEKILYYVKYVVTFIDEEKSKNVLKTLDKDYLERVNELDKIYNVEKKSLIEGNKKKIKKAQKIQEDQLRKIYMDNKSSLEKEYSRVKSILGNLKIGSTILESDYRNIFYKYEDAFVFASGSQSILTLLQAINVENNIKNLLSSFGSLKGMKRKRAFKSLKLLINLHISGVQPEWMVLTRLPVIPPDLRPVVQLEGGKFASSDVNLFYRRVLMRNLRLKRMIQVGMPDVVKKNEIRLLQESVNNLLVGEKGNVRGFGAGVKVFKSLTDMLGGKEGIFRKNLLGKRVDYSGRSVITVGPSLKLNECGLPIYLAVKMFTPFIIGKLIERKIAHTPKQAEKYIKDEDPLALKILEEVIQGKYVLLNRAPTLHRLSIQAFKIKLMPGKTIRIHPLVTPAFNADFDGDQMAVHLPLSEEAQREAREIIASDKNVLQPSSGEPVITHSQDMVIGIYYLTDESTKEDSPSLEQIYFSYEESGELKGVRGRFDSLKTVIHYFNHGELQVKDRILLMYEEKPLITTVGRVIFNNILPEKVRFVNEKVGKKALKKILDIIYDLYDKETTVEIADQLKTLGFKFATLSTVTINVFDVSLPKEKDFILEKAGLVVDKIHNHRFKGLVSDDEKHRLVIGIWSNAKLEIESLVKTTYTSGSDIFSLIDSGARGNRGQMTQMSGMKGLVASPSGEIIELPIKSSLLEGFSPIEYFISAHGARKGKADTALRTAESGYLTRRLVDSSQQTIVREEDCGTKKYLILSKEDSKRRGEKFGELMVGRVLSEDAIDDHGVVYLKKGEMITRKGRDALLLTDIDFVKIKSPLTCRTINGVCQKCFGMDLSTRHIVEIGTPIGVISAQSIGEPGTQLTMRTFHSGGVASAGGDMTHGIKRIEQLFEIRNPKTPSIIVPFDGVVKIIELAKKQEVIISSEPQPKTYIIKSGYVCQIKKGDILEKGGAYSQKGRSKQKVKEEGIVIAVNKEYIVLGVITSVKKKVAIGTSLKVKDGETVYKGQVISTGGLDIREYMKIVSALDAQKYIVHETKKVYTSQGQSVNDKYMEVIVKQLFSKILIEDSGHTSFIPGTIVKYEEFLRMNEKLLATGKSPAIGERLGMGLTQVSKQSDSWMAAASFQETIRVMVEASTKGDIDELKDLKGNVIIGRLLPVGDIYKESYYGKKENTILDVIKEG